MWLPEKWLQRVTAKNKIKPYCNGRAIYMSWLTAWGWLREIYTKTYRVANCKIEGSMTPLPSFVFA